MIEATPIGANHVGCELPRPTRPPCNTGTYFARFWDRLDARGNPLPYIAPISGLGPLALIWAATWSAETWWCWYGEANWSAATRT